MSLGPTTEPWSPLSPMPPRLEPGPEAEEGAEQVAGAAEQPQGPVGVGGADWGAGWQLGGGLKMRGKVRTSPVPAVVVQACPSASR